MTREPDDIAAFERQLRVLLDESVQRVGGRARSRLNQARHAALAEAARPRRWHVSRPTAWNWGRLLWMPAAGAVAAAVLVAFVLWPHPPQMLYPPVDANNTTVADLDLLADRDGMALVQGGGDGQFYEWAMAQTEADPSGRATGPGAVGPNQGQGHGRQSPDPGSGQNSS